MDFQKLLNIIRKETIQQEKLIQLLSKERAAIVNLNQADIEAVNEKKQALLSEAQSLEQTRNNVISGLIGNKDSKMPIKYEELISRSPSEALALQLRAAGDELKKVAITVQELNNHNAELIKQSLGMIVSTISIMKSAPPLDLPTYGQKGVLQEGGSLGAARVTREV